MSGFKRFNKAKGVMGDNVTESQCKHTKSSFKICSLDELVLERCGINFIV